MIQPLRTVHRRAFVALAVVLPAVLSAGLGSRRPHLSPSAPAAEMPPATYLLRKSDKLWQSHVVQSEFYSDTGNPQKIYVTLKPKQALTEPDVLLYWSESEPQGRSLPSTALLLGPFAAGKALALPADVRRASHLLLYSLAHREVIDSATVEALP